MVTASVINSADVMGRRCGGHLSPQGPKQISRGAGEVEEVQGSQQPLSWPHHFLAMGLSESLLHSEPQSTHL